MTGFTAQRSHYNDATDISFCWESGKCARIRIYDDDAADLVAEKLSVLAKIVKGEIPWPDADPTLTVSLRPEGT